MSTASQAATLCSLSIIAAADGMTHLHLYIHETVVAGAGDGTSTAALFAGGSPPPLGGDSSSSSFGSVGAIDDELREGPDPASQFLGRAQGFFVQADLFGSSAAAATCAVVSLAFEEGDYSGSTLVVYGRAGGGGGEAVAEAESAVVGGTGRFRGARGYSLITKLENPAPGTAAVFEMDLYVKIGG